MSEEEKYNHLRKTLKSLPRVQSTGDFEKRLFQKVKLVDRESLARQISKKYSQLEKEKKWHFNLFKPSFASALGLTVFLLIGVIIYFNYFVTSGQKNLSDSKQPSSTEEKKYSTLEERLSNEKSSKEKLEISKEEKRETYSEKLIPLPPVEPHSDFGAPMPRKSEIESDKESEMMEQKLSREKLDAESPKSDDQPKMEKKAPEHIKKSDIESKDKSKGFDEKKENENIIEQDEKAIQDQSGKIISKEEIKAQDTAKTKARKVESDDDLKRPPFRLLEEPDSSK